MCRAAMAVLLLILASLSLRAGEPQPVTFPLTDHSGDPLPTGAVARLGTQRFRTHSGVEELVLSPDGTILVERVGREWVYFFETATGRLIRRVEFAVKAGRDDEANGTIAFGTDGKNVLYGVQLGRLPLLEIDVSSGQIRPIHLLPNTEFLSMTPDGALVLLRQLVTATVERLELFDRRRGKAIATVARFRIQKGERVQHSLSPDGRFLLSEITTVNGEARCEIRDWRTGELAVVDTVPGPIRSRVFNRDNRKLILLTAKAALRYDLGGGGELRPRLLNRYASPFSGDLETVTLSPDERQVLAAGQDGIVLIWDTQSGELLRNWNTCTFGVTDLDFTPDGKTLITSSKYETLPRFWDYATATDRNRYRGHRDAINAFQFDPCGEELISASNDGSIRIWSLKQTRLPIAPRGPIEERYPSVEKHILCETIATFLGLWLSEDGRKLFAMKNDGAIYSWERGSGKLGAVRVSIGQNNIRPPVMSPGGEFVVGAREGLFLFPLDGAKLSPVGVGVGKYDAAAIHADGKTILALNQTGGCECWDPTSGKRIRSGSWPDPDRPLRERYVGVRTEAGVAHVWNRTNGRVVAEFQTVPNEWTLSPSGRYCVQEGLISRPNERGGSALVLTETVSGLKTNLFRLTQMTSVSALQFSPDSKRLAVGFRDGTICLYDLAPPRPLAKPTATALSKAWDDLLANDLGQARRAMGVFLAAPERAMPFLAEKIVPPRKLDSREVGTLLDRLDHPKFRVREEATHKLLRYGEAIEPRLDALEADSPSEEVASRCRRLLGALNNVPVVGERLRLSRAIEILELDGSNEARRILEQSFTSDDRYLWLAARDALERLKVSDRTIGSPANR